GRDGARRAGKPGPQPPARVDRGGADRFASIVARRAAPAPGDARARIRHLSGGQRAADDLVGAQTPDAEAGLSPPPAPERASAGLSCVTDSRIICVSLVRSSRRVSRAARVAAKVVLA